jgi:nucleoside-diphosphate-sugar epimerase
VLLIIGGTGAVGRSVANLVADGGDREVAVVARHEPRPGALRPSVRVHRGDARSPTLGLDPAAATALQSAVEHLVLAVGPVDLGLSLGDARAAHVAPVLGALDFARRCRRLRALTFVSSTAALGAAAPAHPIAPESLPSARFHNFYEWAKHESELQVRASGLPVRVVRPGHVLDDDEVSPICRAALAALGRAPAVPVRDEARYWCAPVGFVAEVVAAATFADTGFDSYAVDPAAPTFGELLDLVAHRYGLRPTRLPAHPWAAWLSSGSARRRRTGAVPDDGGLLPYLQASPPLDLRRLDRLIADGTITAPADRAYVGRAFDRARTALMELA